MVHELTVNKLGKLLKDLTNDYNISLLVKRKLSGGFVTITGEVEVDYFPTEQKTLKGNSIISLKVKITGDTWLDSVKTTISQIAVLTAENITVTEIPE